jgi:hypothetical protein
MGQLRVDIGIANRHAGNKSPLRLASVRDGGRPRREMPCPESRNGADDAAAAATGAVANASASVVGAAAAVAAAQDTSSSVATSTRSRAKKHRLV